MQGPAHADGQHTPSVQKPDRQSASALQTAPFMLGPQLLPLQTFGTAHSAVVLHDEAHSLVEGSQL